MKQSLKNNSKSHSAHGVHGGEEGSGGTAVQLPGLDRFGMGISTRKPQKETTAKGKTAREVGKQSMLEKSSRKRRVGGILPKKKGGLSRHTSLN